MKNTLSAIASSLLLAAGILSFASCQDEDFGFTKEEVVKGKYAREFTQMFGTFPEDFSWDLTDAPLNGSYHDNQGAVTRSAVPESKLEQADANVLRHNGDWYQLEQGTTAWLNKNLVEGRDNRGLGKEFIMNTPKNNFKIIPIFQGVAEMKWDLHIVTEKDGKYYDYNIWSKSHGLRYKKKGGAYVEFASAPSEFDDQANCSLIGKQGIEGQEMTIDHTKLGETFYFYLDITQGSVKEPSSSHHNYKSPSDLTGKTTSNGTQYSFWTNPYNNFAYPMTKQWSDDHMMLALKCPFPTNLGKTGEQPNMALIIGCEDADQRDSDHDMNDVVFLIVGEPDVPDVIELTRKRYMIEDLGGTFDFDFNDVVVDVTQSVHKNILTGEVTKTTQDAEIVAMCGTIPFQVNIGSWNSGIIYRDINSVPAPGAHSARITDKKFSLTGNPWDPSDNNISIQVYANGKNKEFTDNSTTNTNNVYTVKFPGSDETFMATKTPMIIAVHQTQDWKPETETIDESWWEHRLQPTKPTVTAPTTTGHNTIGYSRDDIFEDAEGNLHANLIPALNGTGVVEVTGSTSNSTTETTVTASFAALAEPTAWQHMIKIHTGRAVAADERYDLRFKITSSQPLGENPIVKLEEQGNGGIVLLGETPLKMVYAGGSEYWFTFTDLNMDVNKTLNALDIVLDFRNTTAADITISDVMLQEVPSVKLVLKSSNWDRGGVQVDDNDLQIAENVNGYKYYPRYEPTPTLKSSANSGSNFVFWLDENTNYTYTDAQHTITMDGNNTFKAFFREGDIVGDPLGNMQPNLFTKFTDGWENISEKSIAENNSAYINITGTPDNDWGKNWLTLMTDVTVQPDHKYDFCAKIYTTKDISEYSVKLKKEGGDAPILGNLDGLTMSGEKEYWIKMSDLEWNQAESAQLQFQMNIKSCAVGTEIRISDFCLIDKGAFPASSANVPSLAEANVYSLYSDKYTNNTHLSINYNAGWGQIVTSKTKTLDGNQCLVYDNVSDFVAWDFYDNPVNISDKGMRKLHIDIYPNASGSLKVYLYSRKSGDTGVVDPPAIEISGLEANKWNYKEIDLSKIENLDLSSLCQIKFEKDQSESITSFCLDNVYFSKAPSLEPNKNVTPQHFENGSNSVDVYCVNNGDGSYTMTITTSGTQTITGLGGSYCHVNGVAGYRLDTFSKSIDSQTFVVGIFSSQAPSLYTPLYVMMMPGEVNFDSVTLDWKNVQ